MLAAVLAAGSSSRTLNTPFAVSTLVPTHHRATNALARVASAKKIDTASLRTPRIPDGVMAHPSAPQFSSSQAVIWAWRWPKPPGRKADPDADGEASLGHRDHFAWITRHPSFLIRSHSRSHGCSVLSSRLGLRFGEVMFDPCVVAFASP